MQVVISNVYGDDNRGGSALTQAAIQAVRAAAPGARITLVAVNGARSDLAQTHRHTLAANPDVEVVPALVSVGGRDEGVLAAALSLLVLALPRALLRRVPAVAAVARADLVVGKGGQLFRTRGRRAQLGLWLAMFPVLVAARLGKPTVVYGQAFGPFAGGAGERLSAWLLRRVDLVLLRDDRSVQLAATHGLTGPRVAQVPDTVLSLDSPTEAAGEVVAGRLGLSGRRFAAVTVTHRLARPSAAGGVLEPLADLVARLLDRSVVDEVLVVVQTNGAEGSDLAGSRALVEHCADPRVRLVDDDLPWHELAALYSRAHLVVGGRVHSNILGILGGTPPFPVDNRLAKATDLFGSIGFGGHVLALGSMSTDEAASLIAGILSGDARADVVARRERLRAESRAAYDVLARIATTTGR